MRFLLAAVCAVCAMGAERAGYDSRGRLIALLAEGGEVDVESDFVAVLPNGRRVPLKDRRVGSPPRNQSRLKRWPGTYALPDGSTVRLEWRTEEQDDGLLYEATAESDSRVIERLEFVLDMPGHSS